VHLLINYHPSRIYQINESTCGDCHSECRGTCTGPNANDCEDCANVKDGKFCVPECPYSKYNKDGVCLNCHESCNGCKGPVNTIAEDGCIECDHIIYNNGTIQKCLKKNTTCPGRVELTPRQQLQFTDVSNFRWILQRMGGTL